MWNWLLKVLNNITYTFKATNTRWVDDPITNSIKSIYTSHTFKATNTTWVDDFMPIVAEPCFTASMAYSIWWIRPCSNAIRCITKKCKERKTILLGHSKKDPHSPKYGGGGKKNLFLIIIRGRRQIDFVHRSRTCSAMGGGVESASTI